MKHCYFISIRALLIIAQPELRHEWNRNIFFPGEYLENARLRVMRTYEHYVQSASASQNCGQLKRQRPAIQNQMLYLIVYYLIAKKILVYALILTSNNYTTLYYREDDQASINKFRLISYLRLAVYPYKKNNILERPKT